MTSIPFQRQLMAGTVLALALLSGCNSGSSDAKKLTKPTVNAGRDQLLTLPLEQIALDGKVKSHLEAFDIEKIRWSLDSGPQPVTILDNDREDATVLNVTMAGTYIFKLWAEDSAGRDNSDTVKVVVNAATENASSAATARHQPRSSSVFLSDTVASQAVVESYLLNHTLTPAASDAPMLSWGKTEQNLGIVQVHHLDQQSRDHINQQLDSMVNALSDSDAIVVDLSGSQGGSYLTAQRVAERFFDTTLPVFSLESGQGNVYTVNVTPAASRLEQTNIYLITNGNTAGAAEALTLAMTLLPQVVHLGETTRGRYLEPVASGTTPDYWLLNLNGERLGQSGITPYLDLADEPSPHRAAYEWINQRH
ncbi:MULTISPECIES: PKD domain-containing protein [unclassified Vibrio]|uniref:PKD domain-containing protein n=1 Tax=unclassified Vibrio TaxID=2614977 RepID=UPI001361DF7A|nr:MULTISPECIES: S41 family peptidase [unclassified Vibrio]NAW57510.1 hypothetical protein [Vibrio sp. V36_P2S2PM302]NAX23957.1 hypothetical protein [Vibrio sp. V38_P2S17PM301]NAX30120.1 hypothetical protein [Vibrio sp. V37_P2S8PM304]